LSVFPHHPYLLQHSPFLHDPIPLPHLPLLSAKVVGLVVVVDLEVVIFVEILFVLVCDLHSPNSD